MTVSFAQMEVKFVILWARVKAKLQISSLGEIFLKVEFKTFADVPGLWLDSKGLA